MPLLDLLSSTENEDKECLKRLRDDDDDTYILHLKNSGDENEQLSLDRLIPWLSDEDQD